MTHTPVELIGGILRRLPVKPLLRFRFVCKSWRSLIDSKQFIRMHLQHSLRSKCNRAILLDSYELDYVDLDSSNRLEIDAASLQPESVVACCDGLVLLVPQSRKVTLWNPTTSKMSILPEEPPVWDDFPDYDVINAVFTLGYDSKDDDYKVVTVAQASDDKKFTSEAAIYSLNSNSWKRTADFSYLLPGETSRWGVYLNDALHTVVEFGGRSDVCMAFDLGTEKHRELPMPPFDGGSGGLASVEVLEGRLAAVVPEKTNSEIWIVWLMKEYRVGKSWMKLLRFHTPPPLFYRRYQDLRPLAYSQSGEVVLLRYDGLFVQSLKWYNLRNRGVKTFTRVYSEFDVEFCVGSLVSPFSPGTVKAEKLEDLPDEEGEKPELSERNLVEPHNTQSLVPPLL